VELEIWLAENGWPSGVDGLVRAAYDDPELAPIMERLTSEEAKQQKAVERYVDERHPIPNAPRSVYDTRGVFLVDSEPTGEPHYVDGEPVGPAPDYWGQLPPFEEAPSAKPRHRPPDPIAEATVKQLKWELAQRRTKRRDPELTQEKIAARLGLDRTRIQQAEALEKVGWDLLRSHPEFSAFDEFVSWPSAREAALLLASGNAEN
jgi:hypothetical protein